MAQIGIPYELETPAGVLVFHGEPFGEDGFHLSDVLGLDGEPLRVPVEPRPQADGATVHDAWSSAKYPIFKGYIRHHAFGDERDYVTRNELEGELRSKLRSIRRADGIMRWTPSGYARRRLVVRLLDQVQITRGQGMTPRDWQVAFVAEDPRVYSDTLFTQQTTSLEAAQGSWGWPHGWPHGFGDVSSGGLVSVVNGGDVETPPLVRMYGPAIAPKVKNLTNGQALTLTVLELATGDYVEIDCARFTVTLNGSPDLSLLGALDIASSSGFQLEVGTNVLQYTATQFQAGAFAAVEWRDAWAGG